LNSSYDVIVVGGGTAGMLAAVASARNGAKTLVVERWNHLGGTATCGIPFLGMFDTNGKQVNAGLAQELIDKLVEADGSPGYLYSRWNRNPGEPDNFCNVPFDPEVLKYVAQEMVLEAGADILYHTFVSDVIMDGQKIVGIEIVNKSGKQKIMAKVVIDTSGDADVAYAAGAPTNKGLNGIVQNVSTLFRLGNVDMNKFVEAMKKGDKVQGRENWHTRLTQAEDKNGKPYYVFMAALMAPGNHKLFTFGAVTPRDSEVYMNITRTTGIDGSNGEEVTKAEISERRKLMTIAKDIIKDTPGFENAYLVSTAPLGVRESRNIVGEYVLTQDDVVNCREFEDSVVRGGYPIDIHDPVGGNTMFTFLKGGGSYGIPYGCFLPLNVDNLLVAGRCLSSTHEANGSARMMGSVLSQGQAVGTAAAIAVEMGVTTKEVAIQVLRNRLKEQGAIL